MNAGPINGPGHDAVQSVNLPHQVALAQTANGRIAGHDADAIPTMRDQCHACASARCGSGRFRTGMAAANNNDIKSKGR